MNHYQNNLDLLARIRAGDNAARNALITDNTGLVFACCNKLMRSSPLTGKARWQQRDEFIERGMHGLCQGAARVESIRHDKVGAFLWGHIHGAMLRPDKALIAFLPKGIRVYQEADGEMGRVPTLTGDPAKIFQDKEDWNDTLRLILWACEDKTDLQIVHRRVDGESVDAVATALGMTRQEVWKTIRKIERDFWQIKRRVTSYQL